VSRKALIDHLRSDALRIDGPFTLRSGETSSWYLDARQTTFDGAGAVLVGEAVLDVLAPTADVVGGMTMGADPIAVATAIAAVRRGRKLKAFSIRKTEKDHGTGGRLVGPISTGDRVVVVEDTTTTGAAAIDAAEYVSSQGYDIVQAIAVVDRSGGVAAQRFEELGIPYLALVTPDDLGVSG
jgi:orotate phosphoribosyltransferase